MEIITIIAIVYAISFLLMGTTWLYSKYVEGRKSIITRKDPWYIDAMTYTILFVFAPLLVGVLLPYTIYDKAKKHKMAKKQEAERAYIEKKKDEVRTAFINVKDQVSIKELNECLQCSSRLVKAADNKDYNITAILDKINMPTGSKLIIEEARQDGHGAVSEIQIKFTDGTTTNEIFKHLNFENSFMGAWQAYLLDKLYHSLPVYWHGGYEVRFYIFGKDDLTRIKRGVFRQEDSEKILDVIKSKDTQPIIKKQGNIYYISCCYWSDFEGLIREYVMVEYTKDQRVSVKDIEKIKIQGYKCAIYF